jgi:hypothetical protein
VTLVRVGSAPHHVNVDLRFIVLQFQQLNGGNQCLPQITASTNVLPLGLPSVDHRQQWDVVLEQL